MFACVAMFAGCIDDTIDEDGSDPAETEELGVEESAAVAVSCYATPWVTDLGSTIRFRAHGRCNQTVHALAPTYTATRNGYFAASAAATCGGTYQCYAPYRYVSDPSGNQSWCNRADMSYRSCASCAVRSVASNTRCIGG